MTQVAVSGLFLEAARYDPNDRVLSKAWLLGAFVIASSLIETIFTFYKTDINKERNNASINPYDRFASSDRSEISPSTNQIRKSKKSSSPKG